MWTAYVAYQMTLQALNVPQELWPQCFARKFSQQESDRYFAQSSPDQPDFFVECDKKGDWYIVGNEAEYQFAFGPLGPYPSKTHAINAGIQTFWNYDHDQTGLRSTRTRIQGCFGINA